jgi:hypothetical protein
MRCGLVERLAGAGIQPQNVIDQWGRKVRGLRCGMGGYRYCKCNQGSDRGVGLVAYFCND